MWLLLSGFISGNRFPAGYQSFLAWPSLVRGKAAYPGYLLLEQYFLTFAQITDHLSGLIADHTSVETDA